MLRNRIQQLQNVIRRQQLLAEAVKALQFVTPAYASSVCFRARSDNSLAITAVVRKARRAIQFCVSEMVNVPVGGRK